MFQYEGPELESAFRDQAPMRYVLAIPSLRMLGFTLQWRRTLVTMSQRVTGRCPRLDTRDVAVTTNFTVLLVEDDPDLREAFEFTIGRLGYEVIAFESGEKAYDWLESHLPDIAVLDMMLPQPSGFVLAQRVKERSHGAVPVIMMSGNTSLAHRDYAYASGADRFLPKPFALILLEQAIQDLIPITIDSTLPATLSPRRFPAATSRR